MTQITHPLNRMRGGAADLSNHSKAASLVTFTGRVRLFPDTAELWLICISGHLSGTFMPRSIQNLYRSQHQRVEARLLFHMLDGVVAVAPNTHNFICNTHSSVTSCSSSHASLCVSWLLPVLLHVQMRSLYLCRRASYSL